MKTFLFGLLASAAIASAAPIINEFVAENQHGLADQDGAHSDWVEIYNPDPTPVNLSGYFLTDDTLAPTKWAFPSVTLNSGQFIIVFASGKNRAVAGSELHTNFSLSASGGYLALVQSPGAGPVSSFNYTKQRDGYSFGVSRTQGNANLIGGTTPSYLVPTSAGALPADWNAATTTAGSWTAGTTTGGVGYDTSPPPAATVNAARLSGAVATQSSELGAYPASNAIDGSTANFTHTSGAASDPNPWWKVAFPSDQTLSSILIYNRGDGCCGGRLRDITVEVLDAADTPLWTSAVLNPNNVLNNPTTLSLDLIGLTGSTITARKVKVNRTGNPALGGAHDSYTLSLGEVVATAYTAGGPTPDFNIAPNGVATQSTTLFAAGNAINNNLTDFTHTVGTDSNSTWTLNLNARKKLNNITIYNRSSCCGSRMRDIQVTVRDSDNTTVLYTSPLLNPENTGYAYPNGPATLSLDLATLYGGALVGQYIEIKRIPDPDLSGSSGQGNTDEANVLSLGEVVVSGNDFTSYVQLVGTDVKAAMYNVNTSAFVRYPFTVAPGTIFDTLKLIARYDDGFVAYIDGVKVAEANAPASPTWNSAATGGDRSDILGTRFEIIDLASSIPLLTAGNHVLAIQGLTSAVNDPDFLFHARLEATSQTINSFASYLSFPTPAAHNYSPWYLDFVGDTSFSVKRGFFTTAQSVAITCLTPSSQIYYTTNGNEPTPLNGTLYTAPVNVAATTVLRARAFRTDWVPSNTDTQTYLFLADVLGQQSTGTPPSGWPTSPILNAAGTSQTMVYGMDPNIRTLYGDTAMTAALTQIPSISIVTNQANLTDPATGIYANAYAHGEDWERAASIEWLDPAKPVGFQGEFQHNCGLRIRGGYSRNAPYAKHSFRVYFRDSYSVGKLDYPIFGDAGASEHDVIDLASSQNYSWVLGDGNDTMVRDPFARQTLIDCGSPGSRTRYFHLYLNGIYWGLYWFDERPSAGWGEAYFGGNKDDWDVVKTGNHVAGFATEATDGYYDQMPNPAGGTMNAPWRTLWTKARSLATAPGVTQSGNPDLAAYFEMLGCNADGTRNPALPVLVNVDSLIDYMLCIFYTGDGDAPLSSFLGNVRANNWFALRNRVTDQGFIFLNHDAEHTLGTSAAQNDRTGPWNSTDATFNQNNLSYSNPQWLFQDLCFSPEFRMRVADRAHKHFFNSGAMTPAVAQTRLDALAAKINLAVKGHSIRWGDTARTPAFNATDWQNAVTSARNYLSNRDTTIVSQLRAYNLTTAYADGSAPLYPLTTAPTFSQHGGSVIAGYSLGITAPAGTIYYTTNGIDPRAIGGAVIGTAYTSAVSITQPVTTVKSRVLNGGEWSALTEATFFADVVSPSSANIVFSEIHYHPSNPTPAEITAGFLDADEFEFLEIMNIGANGVNLTGSYFATGIDFTFPATVVAPGARIVLARNAAAFTSRYGFAPAGVYTGKLSNSGENITLRAPDLTTNIRVCTYNVVAPWPVETDGFGPSLVLKNPATNPDHNIAANWRASGSLTPGGSDASGYAAWKTTNGIANDTDDTDGDGLSPLLEYALGGSPSAASLASLPTTVKNPDGSFTFTLRRALTADDVSHEIQETSDLANVAFTPAAATLISRTAAGGVETYVYTIPASPATQRFFRVRILAF
jgi:hypothetical protein